MNQSSPSLSELGLRLVLADVSLVSPDLTLEPLLSDLDIHGDDKYIPIEFAGAVAAVVFTVSLSLSHTLATYNLCLSLCVCVSAVAVSNSVAILLSKKRLQ